MKTFNDIIEAIPSSNVYYNTIHDIFSEIGSGRTWKDVKDMFVNLPDSIHISKVKGNLVWLPRKVQLDIGKIEEIRAVQILPPAQKRKAVYHEYDEYINNHDDVDPGSLIVVKAFKINCACGAVFIGREPEHQLRCQLCKTKIKIKSSDEDSAVNSQISLMLKILGNRRLNNKFRKIAETKLLSMFKKDGLSDEQIMVVCDNADYPSDRIKVLLDETEQSQAII